MCLDKHAAKRRRFARLLGTDGELGCGLPIGADSSGRSETPPASCDDSSPRSDDPDDSPPRSDDPDASDSPETTDDADAGDRPRTTDDVDPDSGTNAAD